MNQFQFITQRQKRRLLATTVASAADCSSETLERRLLLTVPDPVVITSLESSDSNDNLAELTWEAQEGVDTYEIWVSQLGYGQIDNPIVEGSQSSAFVGAADGDWHRVWIRGINEDGTGPWGPALTAIVGDELPARPTLSTWQGSDIYTTDTTPSFNWGFTEHARQFDVWVQKDGETEPYHRSTQDAPLDGRSNRLTAWTPAADIEDGVYRVWVRGRNANGVSAWSDSTYRAVGGEQPEITGTTDSGVALRPTITWTEGVESVGYQLWVSSDSTGQRVLLEPNLTTNSFTPTEDLEAGIYRAWVRQTPVVGIALPWSSVRRFEVGQNTIPGTPVLTASPDPAGQTFHENLILEWDSVSLADHYEVSVASTRIGQVIARQTSETLLTIPLGDPINFGDFRAWVRAIGNDGTPGEWSSFLVFRATTFADGRHQVFLP